MEIRDVLYLLGLAVGVAGSHFMLRAKVLVLEERIKGYSKAIGRVEEALQRIENKLDKKVDRQ